MKNILAFVIGLMLIPLGYLFFQPEEALLLGSSTTGSTWFLNAAQQIQAAKTTWTLRIPFLANCNTIDTDANGIFSCGTDATGGGGGGGAISTSTALANTQVVYATGASTVGSEAAFTYDASLNKLTFGYGSTTALTATTLYGALVGNAQTATALSANPSNCSAGSYPLGIAANGAVETCTADAIVTAGDALTLTGTDIDFDGGATPSGDLGGTWASPSVTDNSHAHDATTISGLGTADISGLDISDDTNLAVSATGIELSGDTIALTSGYRIPTTTLMANLGTFYNTPSNRITAGTGIDWSSNTLNGVYTAGDGITLNSEDFDFDGGASPAGALGGTWASPTVDDDGHAHTGTTLSAIDLSSDVNLTAGDALTLTDDDIDFDGGATPGGELGNTWASPSIDDSLAVTSWNLTTPTLTSFFGTPCTGNQFLQDIGDTGTFSCATAAGGGGGGSISTSTAVTAGNLAYWTSSSALSQVATGTLTENLTGLEFNATRGLVGGAAILSLTSGYNIPLTASTTQWRRAHASTSALSFGDTSTIDGTYTGTTGAFSAAVVADSIGDSQLAFNTGQALTTASGVTFATVDTGQGANELFDMDQNVLQASAVTFATLDTGQGANELYDMDQNVLQASTPTFGGLTVTPLTSALLQTNGSGVMAEYAGSGTCTNQFVTVLSALGIGTCASVTSAAITDNEILEGDLNADNSPGDTDFLQYDSTGTNFIWRTLAETAADLEASIEAGLDTLTSLVSVAISTTLAIPFGTACDSNADGEICQDTTDNQLIVDGAVVPTTGIEIFKVTVASTSIAYINSDLLKIPTQLDGYTITAIRCSVDGGTSKVIAIEDESANASEDITCATSVTSDDGTITNATYTAGEESYIDFGATSGVVDYVTISVFGTWTRE